MSDNHVERFSNEYPEFEYTGEFNEAVIPGTENDDAIAGSLIPQEDKKNIPVGLELDNWKEVLENSEFRESFLESDMQMLSKWIDFWAIHRPFKGVNSEDMINALGNSQEVKILGPKPNFVSYADNYRDRAEDALTYLFHLSQDSESREYLDEILRGHIPSEVKKEIDRIVQDLVSPLSVEELRELYASLIETYPNALMQFRSFSSMDAYRKAYPDDTRPISVYYNAKTGLMPWEAAVEAIKSGVQYTIDLNQIKGGIRSRKLISLRGSPTKNIKYSWKNIATNLMDYTNVVILNADHTQAITNTKGMNFRKLDEFMQIVRGRPTHLGTMMNDMNRLNYSGMVVIERPIASNPTKANRELTEVSIIVNFIKEHFNPKTADN